MPPRAKAKIKEITLTAVGLTYRLTPHQFVRLEEEIPIACELRREPENEHDPNAIAVYGREKPFKGMKIGYIARAQAAEFAPRMDAEELEPVEVWLVELHVSKSGIGGEGRVATMLVKV